MWDNCRTLTTTQQQEVVVLAKEGDTDACGLLIESMVPLIKQEVTKWWAIEHDDAIAIAVTAMLSSIKNYDERKGCGVATFLKAAARRRLGDYHQKVAVTRGKRDTTTISSDDVIELQLTGITEITMSDLIVMPAHREDIPHLLSFLSAPQRKVVELRLKDLTFQQIGDMLSISKNGALKRYNKAVEKLREIA